MSFCTDLSEPYPCSRPVQAFLDGVYVPLPSDTSSLAGVRFHLETLALQQSRILTGLQVDGSEVNLSDSLLNHGPFAQVEAQAVELEQVPVQSLPAAQEQIAVVRSHVFAAVSQLLINDSSAGRFLWWNLAVKLKHPLLALGAVTDPACRQKTVGALMVELRQWHIQQLAAIMNEVEEISWLQDTAALSDALEQRVLPWLAALEKSIASLEMTFAAEQSA